MRYSASARECPVKHTREAHCVSKEVVVRCPVRMYVLQVSAAITNLVSYKYNSLCPIREASPIYYPERIVKESEIPRLRPQA